LGTRLPVGQALAVHQLAAQGLDVDGLVQRAPHAQVLEGVATLHAAIQQLVAELVHADEDDAALRPVDDLHAGRAAQPGDVARGRVEHEVDLARHQRRQARGVVGDGRVDGFGDVAAQLPHHCGLRLKLVLMPGWRFTSMKGPVPLALKPA
jgi:hypothetical protein